MRESGLLAAVLMASLAGAFGQVPPANDDFVNRTVLSGSSITFTGTLVGATYESAETNLWPYNSFGSGSVWWTWTAPASSHVVITMLRDYSVASSGSGLYVFAGTNLTALTVLAGNGFDAPAVRYVSFDASAGEAYQFRLWGGCLQPLTFKLTATNPPIFLIQPKDCVVSPYGSALFTTATSDVGLNGFYNPPTTRYQWTFNGVPLPGENYPGLVIHGVTTNNAGSYSLIASNAGGVSQSSPALLTVVDTNPVPRLAAVPATNSASLLFLLTGEPGRWYEIESSQDLVNWGNPIWVQPTNATSLLSVPRLGSRQFVRASLNVGSDICLAQLKRMRAAFDIVAVETKVGWLSGETLEFIGALVPRSGPRGQIPACPDGGTYSPPATVVEDPTCSIHGRGHNINGQ